MIHIGTSVILRRAWPAVRLALSSGIAFGLACGASAANSKGCSREDGIAALAVTGYLESWPSIHRAFRQYGHCVDGAIAEGFSEAVARQLVDYPRELDTLRKLAASDPPFGDFVVGRVNATLEAKDLSRIARVASVDCRPAQPLCTRLEAAAREALHDQRWPEPAVRGNAGAERH